jgi:hypothetical protein
MPLWVWNGEITCARITEMLEQFAAQGMGGVFVHPRTGLVTEYLGDEWFQCWEHALRECERLGLACHIYDENSYPSGFAGGHVVARNPHAVGRYFRATPVDSGLAPRWVGQRWYRLTAEGGAEPAVAPGPGEGGRGGLVAVTVEAPAPELWHGGFPYVDLSRPGAGEEFIATTHARYAERFGAVFGQTVRYAFTDEPSLADTNGPNAAPHFLAAFRAEHGYALEDRLAAFLADTPDAPAVRHDYFATQFRLWRENFLRPLHDWCAAHGLEFTGHFNEHHWPNAVGNPSCAASQRWMQVPGIDLLGFQFKPRDPPANGLMLLTLREVASVARQLGRTRVLCETAGGGGYQMGPAGIKRLVDFALAHGVTLVNPHLSHQTLAGVRKFDWPQTLGDHASWWPFYRPQADHEARCVAALAAGHPPARLLVLQPTTTGWLHSLPRGWGFTAAAQGARARLDAIRHDQVGLVGALANSHLEFDLGDELILAELARADAAGLHVGPATYDTVVVPSTMGNLLPETVGWLAAFLAGGGHVFAAGAPPALVRGRPDARVAELAVRHAARWHAVPERSALVAALADRHPPPVAEPDGRPLQGGPAHRRVVAADDTSLHFWANPWDQPLALEVRLAAACILNLDTGSGRAVALATRPAGGGELVARLELPPGGHALWAALPESVAAGAESAPPIGAPAAGIPVWRPAPPAEFLGAEPGGPNVLALDYCDIELPDGSRRVGENSIRADLANWQAHGFEKNLWNFSIQFRRTFVEAPVPDPRGCAVEYPFTNAPGADPAAWGGVDLAVECPWRWRVSVNGVPIDFAGAPRWWDENLRRTAIGAHLRPGANRVRLETDRFSVRHEIATIYLLGDFALEPAETGFALTSPRPTGLGDWRALGRPFDGGTVAYRFRLEWPAGARRWRLRAPGWQGSALAVRLDGDAVGVLFEPAGILEGEMPDAAAVNGAARTVTFTLVLAGNLQNQLGPHFSDGLPGPWSWQQQPSPEPPGAAYRFFPTGLSAPPVVEWSE